MKAGELFLVTTQAWDDDYSIYGLYRAKIDFEPKNIETWWVANAGSAPAPWINWLLKQGFVESVDYEEFLF